jgi:hypothetical protein
MICLLLSACATETGVREEFDRSVKNYNKLLRWHEMESAIMTYSDPEQRDIALKQADSLKKRGLSVVDFRILAARYIPEKKAGDVMAEFDYYLLPSNRIKTISNRQEWVYQEELKIWKLKNGLPFFE